MFSSWYHLDEDGHGLLTGRRKQHSNNDGADDDNATHGKEWKAKSTDSNVVSRLIKDASKRRANNHSNAVGHLGGGKKLGHVIGKFHADKSPAGSIEGGGAK